MGLEKILKANSRGFLCNLRKLSFEAPILRHLIRCRMASRTSIIWAMVCLTVSSSTVSPLFSLASYSVTSRMFVIFSLRGKS